jgi:CyaY protein
MPTDSDYLAACRHLFSEIESALLACGEDIDFVTVAEGVVEIEFPDGAKMVLNRHQASQEVWLAARSGAFHFRLQGDEWIDTRGGERVQAVLSRLVAAQTGMPLNWP